MTISRDDPHYRRSLRETRLILAIFAVVTAIVLTVCYTFGYQRDTGVRATLRGAVSIGPPTVEPAVIRIEGPPRKDGSASEASSYDVPAGWVVRVVEGQSVGSGALLAAPPGRVAVATVAGVPRWVFWGLLVPWGVCTAVTLWFAAVFLRDENAPADPGAPHVHAGPPGVPGPSGDPHA